MSTKPPFKKSGIQRVTKRKGHLWRGIATTADGPVPRSVLLGGTLTLLVAFSLAVLPHGTISFLTRGKPRQQVWTLAGFSFRLS